jgi:hypothetical protein
MTCIDYMSSHWAANSIKTEILKNCGGIYITQNLPSQTFLGG